MKVNPQELAFYKERIVSQFSTDKDRKEAERVIYTALRLGYSQLKLVHTGDEPSIHDLTGVDQKGILRFLYME